MFNFKKHFRFDSLLHARKMFLVVSSVAAWIVGTCYGASFLLLGGASQPMIAGGLAMPLLFPAVLLCLRMTRDIRVSSLFFLFALTVNLLFGIYLAGGVISAPAVSFVAVPLFAGFLLGRLWAAISGAAVLTWLGILSVMHLGGDTTLILSIGIVALTVMLTMILSHLVIDELTVRLAKARHQVLQESHSKSGLMSSMSHEIRTAMNGITAGLSLLLERDDLPKDVRGQVRLALDSSHSLLDVVRDVTDLSRLESGRQSLDALPFHPLREVEDVVFLHDSWAGEKRLKLKHDLQIPKNLQLVGDAARLRQVLVGLISSAVKSTDSGIVRVNARAERRDAKSWTLSIDVIGGNECLQSEDPARLFKRSEAIEDAQGAIQRMGLDLGICKQIIDLMGGHIAISGHEDKASAFRVRLNLPSVEDQPESARQGSRDWSVSLSGLNVLVVEDDRTSQIVIGNILEVLDCRTAFATSGREALGAVQGQRFDLILLDINLPDMDGVQILRSVRDLGVRYADIPVIAVTATALEGDRERFLAGGIDGYVAKPFEAAMLVAEIRSVLGVPSRPPRQPENGAEATA